MSVRGCCTVSLLYFICTVPTDLLDVLYTDDGYYQRPGFRHADLVFDFVFV